MKELGFAIRQLAKSPGFAAVAIVTLALGIGLSASSFSMANAFLLRNVPYPEADRLVRVFASTRQAPRTGHAPGNIIDVRENATSFSGFALYNGDNYALGDPGQPAEQVFGMAVTADFFHVIGVQPALGRGFAQGEDREEQAAVAVLPYRTWVRRYAADPAIIGRTVRLNAVPYVIVGVLPDTFHAPIVWGPVEVLIPRTMPPSFRTNRRDTWMQAVGRLKPGVTLRQAQAELGTLAAQLEQGHPKENEGRGLTAVGLAQANLDSVSRTLLWLMTGVGLAMLLVACANLASLQVARAFVRSREFAIRAALGGNRRQLMGPLLVESLVLAALGGLGGLLVAWWSNDLIGSALRVGNEAGFDIPIDGRVLAFTAFASLLSGLAFGLAPAWLASRSPAAEALKEGARSATGSASHQRMKRVLIIAELALALTMVGVAAAFGLGAKSFVRRDVGWSMDNIFMGFLALPYEPYGHDARSWEFCRELLPRLAALPGVQHAALANTVPMFALGPTVPFSVEGRPEEESSRRPTTQVGVVTSDYFAALRIPLKEGKTFPPELRATDPAVAVINEAFARKLWPGESALGRRVRLGDDGPWIEIVGVVADVGMLVRFTALDTPFQLYRPLVHAPTRYFSIALRASVAPESLTKSVREAVASLDPDVPVAQPGSMRAQFERNMRNLDLVITNLAISAGMGLLIAAVGLFGVISQLTAQRTRDIGVRIALGARSTDIMRMIIGEGARMLLIGLLCGVPAYYALTLVLNNAMPSLRLPGLWLLATNIAVLAVTVLIACFLPARRATRINPVEALRTE